MRQRRSTGSRRCWAAALSGAVLLLAAGGCSSTRTVGYQRPIPPKPKQARPAPPDARANAVVMTLGAAPRDTNGNGYPDLIYATTHLFDRRYAPPLHQAGEFVFQLYAVGEVGRPDAAPLHEWRFAGDAASASRGRSGFGMCYRFRLSLVADGGTDQLGVPMADMVCRFEPADAGAEIVSSEVTTIQIGRRVLVPQLIWSEQAEAEPAPTSIQLDVWP